MKTIVQTAILILLLSPPISGEPRDKRTDDRAAKVDHIFAKWNRPDVPGCAVGIVQDGRLIYAKGFGSANLNYEVPNTPTTVFETGSMTKSFTGACIALLLDQGKISPDDDIRKYLPEMHRHDPPIRVRHMIRCRSGLWAQWHLVQLAGWSSEPIESPYSGEDLLTLLSRQKSLPFKPGTKFRYGSSDYFLLGQIVQRVTGKSLAMFAQENLFDPLGMKHTRFTQDPTQVVKHRAVGHYRNADGAWRQWSSNMTAVGGWGLKTCVHDLVLWERNFLKCRLPRGEYLDRFISDGTLLDNRNVLDATPTGSYRGLKRIQFTGGMPGFHAAMVRFPKHRFTVICLSNNGEIIPWNVAKRIADLHLADKFPEPEPKKPSTDDSPHRFIELPEKDLRSKVGAYRMKGVGPIWTITFRDGVLYWTDQLKRTYPLKPVSATTFRPRGSPIDDNEFVFHRIAADAPFSLTLQWTDGKLKFERVVLVTPTKEELSGYAGEYFSDELAVTYRFAIRDAGLWLRVGNRRWERLDPMLRDEFTPHVARPFDLRIFTFLRDETNKVGGVNVALARVKGVRFERR